MDPGQAAKNNAKCKSETKLNNNKKNIINGKGLLKNKYKQIERLITKIKSFMSCHLFTINQHWRSVNVQMIEISP